ncbi:transposase [Streptomyces sp. NEAU-L66]|uniref:transposase n=1 Tax=Streptomyces sp. NEAU-L66 TaxID=3390812 RepID=UPI0039C62370
MGSAGAASSGGEEAGGPRTWTRRQLINGIRWRTRAGTPWRDAPERYGLWDRIYDLFRRWQRDVTWKRNLEQRRGEGLAQVSPSSCQMSAPGVLFTFGPFGIAGSSRCFEVTSRIA